MTLDRSRLALVLALAAALPGCRSAVDRLDPAPGHPAAAQMARGVATRWTEVERTGLYATSAARISRYALVPGGIFDDSTLWTFRSGAIRAHYAQGSWTGEHYRYVSRPSLPVLTEPGSSRDALVLTRTGDGEYRWETVADLHLGRVHATNVGDLIPALLTSAEGRPQATVMADYQSALPRTTAAMGRLFSMDSILSVRLDDGTARTMIVATARADRLRATGFPNFAHFVDRYVGSATSHLTLTDAAGARWLEADLAGGRFTIRVRGHDGHLAPLEGEARTMPDSLMLDGDFQTKLMLFHVGVRHLVGTVGFVHGPRERGFLVRFRREPGWKLPPVTRALLRSPLRFPFEGEGSWLRMATVEGTDGGTVMSRTSSVAVKESAILRWLNALGFSAVNDYLGPTEVEENRFFAELFRAMAEDVARAP